MAMIYPRTVFATRIFEEAVGLCTVLCKCCVNAAVACKKTIVIDTFNFELAHLKKDEN